MDLSPELLARLTPAADAGLPRTRQLYLALYAAVVGGELPFGSRLPPVRELAAALGVGRNTVLEVYGQLGDEGLLHGERRLGTRVAYRAPARSSGAAAAWRVSTRAEALPPLRAGHATLMPGEPDVSLFPGAAWRRALARAARQAPAALRYRTRPLPELQQAIARWLATYRSLLVEPEQVVVTSSTRQSLALAAALCADPGDHAWIESPGYRGAVDAFVQLGLRPVPCAVDGDGLVPPADLAPPRLVYLTPGFQFPGGYLLAPHRRDALLELSRRHGTVLFEDDYDSEFRDHTQPRPALAAAAGDARVLHAGTFSKLLFPAARVAWLVVPAALAEHANRCLRVLGGGHQTVVQRAVALLLDGGDIARHLQRARGVYARRREALVDALARSPHFDPGALHAGSLNGVAGLRTPVDLATLEHELDAAGLGAVPLERMRWEIRNPRRSRALVLGLGNVDSDAVAPAVRRLGRALAAAAAGS